MNTREYQQLAYRTASIDKSIIKSRLESPEIATGLNVSLEEIQLLTVRLDGFKKFLFYGKTNDSLVESSKKLHDMAYHVNPLRVEIANSQARQISQDMVLINLLHGIIGVATELGEIMEEFFKNPELSKIDRINMKEEVGDIFWYLNLISRSCGFSFDEAMFSNIRKLETRYGDQFSEEKAIYRNSEIEREALEK